MDAPHVRPATPDTENRFLSCGSVGAENRGRGRRRDLVSIGELGNHDGLWMRHQTGLSRGYG